MATESERPTFTHRPARHGLIGPFSGRQLLAGAIAVLVVAIIGVIVTTPLGNTANQPDLIDPLATPFIIGQAPAEGLQAGQQAPELTVDRGNGSPFQLQDLDGNPVTLAGLRGKVVWLNFFASWCPPCQQETPILRRLADTYRDRGLEVIGISVQETTAADVKAYADRYRLGYTIGFDGSGDVLREYRVFALPTQFFIDTSGVIQQVVSGPVDEQGARALIESLLPGSGGPSASPAGS
ncbi:MAG TPA: TlpA disulfide reductase family protein [Candidatus Limnocylindrales bacterium]|nr:TlpA disulfide reductase family protein [Candidatus Limnocylindrales bacterium]